MLVSILGHACGAVPAVAPKRTRSGPGIVTIIILWQLGSNKNIALIVRTAVSYYMKVFKNISTTFCGVEDVGVFVNNVRDIHNV